MMMSAIETMMPRPRSTDILRSRQPALRHAGSLGRCSGSSCFTWLLLAVCILVVSGGTSAMPATAVEGHEATAEDLGAMLDAGEGAVATLVAGNTRLAVHTAVLAARSPVFSAMFAHEPLKSSSGDYVLSDVEGPELRKLVAFMYSGRAPRPPGMTPQLLEAATKYGVSGLREAFEHQLARQLTVDNVAAKAVLAVKHDYPTLKRAAVPFIRDHVFQVEATPGWVEAVHNYPGAVVEITRLLVDSPTETSEASPNAQSNSDEGRTSPAATPTSDRPHTPTLDDGATSHYGAPAIVGTMATATMRPHDGRSSAAATTPLAHLHTTTLHDAALSSLSAPAIVGTMATATMRLHDGRSSAAATPPSAHLHTSTLHDAALSSLSTTAAEDSEATPTTPPHSDHGRSTAAAMTSWGCPDTPPLDEVEVSRLRMLSGGEKGERLWKAVKKGEVGEVRALLAAGADVGARDGNERTALHWAGIKGHVEEAGCLLQAGAEVDARDRWQETTLHFVAWNGHTAVVRLLLAASADVDARNEWGWTPLHWAAFWDQAETATAMLEAGADRGARDNEGKTPLDIARQYNRQRVIQILETH